MILPLLLAVAPQAGDPLIATARARLSVVAEGAATAPSWRVDARDTSTPTAKDHAIRDDGSKCNVVGARRCARRGRTLFRTDFSG